MLDFFSFTSGVSSSYSPPPKIQRPKTVSISGVVRLYNASFQKLWGDWYESAIVGSFGWERVELGCWGGGGGQAIVSAAKNKFFGIFLEHLCRI